MPIVQGVHPQTGEPLDIVLPEGPSAPPKPAAPTVHLNGSSADGLIRDYCDAVIALAKALDALAETAPHPRDYYVQPDHPRGFEEARRAHEARLAMIRQCHHEIEALGVAVLDQRG